MTEQEKNIQLVKDVFAAVNRADLRYVLNQMADNIDWQSPVTNTIMEPISWAKPRHGKAEVNDFFKELFERVKIIELKPQTFTAQEDRVLVEGTTRGIVNQSGREYLSTWTMALTVRAGKCVRMRHYYDTVDIAKEFPVELRRAA